MEKLKDNTISIILCLDYYSWIEIGELTQTYVGPEEPGIYFNNSLFPPSTYIELDYISNKRVYDVKHMPNNIVCG
ncbi:hypothetical protein G9A89_018120 [Geosiphon pyriformis]|nr:hypothetical protein G9A89_018120 [Geosiphon pyriformis]